jgi:hypothetical protein
MHFGGGGMHFGGSPHFGGVQHFGGMHLGGGGTHFSAQHFGGTHFAAGRFGGQHFGARPIATPLGGHAGRFAAAHGAQISGAVPGAATAGFGEARAFRHGQFDVSHFRRGYVGWAGPVFWPYAYDDFVDYAFWPYADAYNDQFWAYGYDDLFAGTLLPYDYAAVYGYAPAQPATVGVNPQPSGGPPALAQSCGSPQAAAGAPSIDSIAQAVKPTPEQRAKLDALANSQASAEKTLRASCGAQVPTTALARLDEVQTRLQAMIAAANTVRMPLDDFYSSLTDEQKARFNAIGQSPQTPPGAAQPASPAQLCGPQNAVPVVSSERIERAVQPDAQQRSELVALRDAATKADDMILAACPAEAPLTPPGRLQAVLNRLEAMVKGVETVRPALQSFYASLTTQQKARFDAMSEQPALNGNAKS